MESSAKRVSSEQAMRLMRGGYTFVDVRSEPEFADGHPKSALNVPLRRVSGDRLVDNDEFLRVIGELIPRSTPLIVGCHSGSRSRVARLALESAGYPIVLELLHGFAGARDDFGRRLPGWESSGLPVERGEPPGRCYADLLLRISTT